jgi:hypothetical protein
MLFVMARYMNKVVGLPDIKWEKGGGIHSGEEVIKSQSRKS